MGLTYVRSFLKSHLVPADHLTILEKSTKKADEIRKLNIGRTYHDSKSTIIDW